MRRLGRYWFQAFGGATKVTVSTSGGLLIRSSPFKIQYPESDQGLAWALRCVSSAPPWTKLKVSSWRFWVALGTNCTEPCLEAHLKHTTQLPHPFQYCRTRGQTPCQYLCFRSGSSATDTSCKTVPAWSWPHVVLWWVSMSCPCYCLCCIKIPRRRPLPEPHNGSTCCHPLLSGTPLFGCHAGHFNICQSFFLRILKFDNFSGWQTYGHKLNRWKW